MTRDQLTPADDECIELAQALEQLRALKIVEAVAALPIGGAEVSMPTPFHSGYQAACEEITYRLLTEEWDMCLKPAGLRDPSAHVRRYDVPGMRNLLADAIDAQTAEIERLRALILRAVAELETVDYASDPPRRVVALMDEMRATHLTGVKQ